MSLKRRVPNIRGEPLMMLRYPASTVDGIEAFKFRQNSRSKSSVYQILRVIGYSAGTIHFHPPPLPPAKPENLLIEIIRESFGPRRVFFPQVFIEDVLQGLSDP